MKFIYCYIVPYVILVFIQTYVFIVKKLLYMKQRRNTNVKYVMCVMFVMQDLQRRKPWMITSDQFIKERQAFL